MSKKGLLTFAALNGFVALVIGLIFIFYRGGATLLLMGLGAFFLLLYTYPLKHFALGELSLLIVWGPLMVGGGFYVLTGIWNWDVVLAGMPFALGVMGTLIGKHLDKLDMEGQKYPNITCLDWREGGPLFCTGDYIFPVWNTGLSCHQGIFQPHSFYHVTRFILLL